MIKHLLSGTAFMALTCYAATTYSAEFENVYVFGDSLSDNGNVFEQTGNTTPPPPYFEGRFSNGPVWAEKFAPGLTPISINPTATNLNMAFGGAESGIVDAGGIPGFLGQLGLLQQAVDGGVAPPDGNDLITLFIGGNDYLGLLGTAPDVTAEVATVQNNIATGLGGLYQLGARNFLVFNLPDLGTTPLVNDDAALSAFATNLSGAHNAALPETIAALQGNFADANFIFFDTETLFNYVLDNSALFGFTNVTEGCLNDPACATADKATQDSYVFWDDIHPTEGMGTLIAAAASELVNTDRHLVGVLSQSEVGLSLARSMTRPLTTRLHQSRSGLERRSEGDRGFGLFFTGQYIQGERTLEATAARTAFEYNYSLFTLGADYHNGENLLIGIAGSYASGDATQDLGGGFDLDSWQIAGYATYLYNAFALELYGGDGSTDYENIQRPTALSPIVATAETGGDHTTIGGQAAYRFEDELGSVEAFAGLRYIDLGIDGYQETEGVIFNLDVNRQDVSSLVGLLGLRFAGTFTSGEIQWAPRASIAYEHEFDGDRSLTGRIVNNTATPVTVSDDLLKDHVIALDLGLDVAVGSLVLSGGYQAELGLTGGQHEQVVGSVRMRF